MIRVSKTRATPNLSTGVNEALIKRVVQVWLQTSSARLEQMNEDLKACFHDAFGGLGAELMGSAI